MIFGLHTYNDLVKNNDYKGVKRTKFVDLEFINLHKELGISLRSFATKKNMDNTSGYKKVDSNT